MIKPDPDHRQRISDEDEEMEAQYQATLKFWREARIADLHERSDRAPEPGKVFKTVFYLSAFLFAVAVIAAVIGLGVIVYYLFKP